MELKKSSVKLPHIRLAQWPILRKTYFARLGWIITSRKNICKKIWKNLIFLWVTIYQWPTDERIRNIIFSLRHIFLLDSKWKTKYYFECFYLVEWEMCLCYYGRVKKFLLRLRNNMKPSTPHFFQILKLFICQWCLHWGKYSVSFTVDNEPFFLFNFNSRVWL